MPTRPLTLNISGMSCSHCVNAVNQALGRLQGVSIESVRIGRADLRFDEAVVKPEQITAAVEDAGYGVRVAEPTDG
ncbi:MAG TPA: cation transporter [Gemmatimonadales bacterium]